MQLGEYIMEKLAGKTAKCTAIDHVLGGGFITEEYNLWKVPSFT